MDDSFDFWEDEGEFQEAEPSATNKQAHPSNEEFVHLCEEEARIEKETKEVDALAEELAFTINIRRDFETCEKDGKVPIEFKMQVDSLTDGGWLIQYHLRNRTDRPLDGWQMILFVHSLDRDDPHVSRSVAIPRLPPDASTRGRVLAECPRHLAIVYAFLSKEFPILNREYVMTIPIGWRVLSAWDRVDSFDGGAPIQSTQSLRINQRLFDRSLEGVFPSGSMMLDEHEVHVQVIRGGTDVEVRIGSRSGRIRSELMRSLQLLVVSRMRDCSRFSSSTVSDFSSIESIFASLSTTI